MKIDIITNALNKWLDTTFIKHNGRFISRVYEKGTAFGPYKKFIGEVYYCINNDNILITEVTVTINSIEATEEQRDALYTNITWDILTQLEDIKTKIKNVEQISNLV